jgi:hypothetical protein
MIYVCKLLKRVIFIGVILKPLEKVFPKVANKLLLCLTPKILPFQPSPKESLIEIVKFINVPGIGGVGVGGVGVGGVGVGVGVGVGAGEGA